MQDVANHFFELLLKHKWSTLTLLGVVAHRVWSAKRIQLKDRRPGVMVKADGFGGKQHVLVTGPTEMVEKPDTVVLVHGFGCTALEWAKVLPELAKRCRVVCYERIVMVEPQKASGNQPRSAQVLGDELRQLLRGVGIGDEEQVFLVGHSYGGLICQVFAMNFPDRVKGMVLIDPAHENQYKALPRDFAFFLSYSSWIFALYRFIAPLGAARLLDLFGVFNFPPLFLFPAEQRKQAIELYSDSFVWSRVIDELRGSDVAFEAMAELRSKKPLPEVPICILFAGDRRYSPTLFPDAATEAFKSVYASILTLPNVTSMTASKSDHWIHLQQPELVLSAINSVLGSASKVLPDAEILVDLQSLHQILNFDFFVRNAVLDKSLQSHQKKMVKKGKKEEIEEPVEVPFVSETGRSLFRLATARGVAVYKGEWKTVQIEIEKETEAEPVKEKMVIKVQEGWGSLTFEESEGECFEGQWRDGHMFQGDYHFENGDSYTGSFNNDGRFHGKGKLVSEHGRYIYDGGWENGKFHGQGTLILEDLNSRWSGQFKNGQFQDTGSHLLHFDFDPKSLPPTLRDILLI